VAIFVEMIVSAITFPLRWLARRYPKPLFVIVILATTVLILQVEFTGRVEPKLFSAVFSVVLLCAVCMVATLWPTPIDDDRPQRPRLQPQKVEDWFDPIS
jgi:hypothetical protein